MLDKELQTGMLLELVFSAYAEKDEHNILKKSIPLYLRKLNCFMASVLKNRKNHQKEILLMPYVANKSESWSKIKNYFSNRKPKTSRPCSQLLFEGSYYYSYCLSTFGYLILGRKKPFSDILINELEPIVNHLGKLLIQVNEIEQRKKVEKSLKQSEQQLRTLSNTTTAGIFIFDDENILYSNYAAETLSGYSKSELKALNITDIVHPDFKRIIHKHKLEIILGKKESSHLEIKIFRKNGEVNWMDIHIGLIKWKKKKAGIASAFNITKRKQAEKDLIAAKIKAEESDLLKSAFLANISHEIRTPMNSILGFAELLNETEVPGELQSRYLDVIEKNGRRMLNIINDIVDISKIEAGQFTLQIQETNLNQILIDLHIFFMPETKAKKLNMIYHSGLPNDQCIIQTDRTKLLQILTNLIKNALKFTNKGNIDFGYKLKSDFIEFYVSDTGCGIDPNQKENIFERFRQGNLMITRGYEGAGLGLSISKSFVEILGGKIWVESELGKKSTFYFTIPHNPTSHKQEGYDINRI